LISTLREKHRADTCPNEEWRCAERVSSIRIHLRRVLVRECLPLRENPRHVRIWAPTQPIYGSAGYGMGVSQISYRKPRWRVEVAWDFSPTLLT
jgi:hypothetical protein